MKNTNKCKKCKRTMNRKTKASKLSSKRQPQGGLRYEAEEIETNKLMS